MEIREGSVLSVLSPREMEVLDLLIKGFTNRQIAASLSISLNTVSSHMKNIQSKLGTTNRVQSVLMAIAGSIGTS